MTHKRFFGEACLFFLSAIFVPFAAAQNNPNFIEIPSIGTISGMIVDSLTNEPIDYATVTVTHQFADSIFTGGVTNAKGKFYIEKIKLGGQVVEIGFIGYQTKTFRNIQLEKKATEAKLGTIFLVPTSYQISELVVLATKGFAQTSIDRKTYDPAALIGSQNSSAIEVLQNIPSVDFDMNGNLTLRGSESLRVLIDGKPSRYTGEDLTNLLQSLPGNSIAKIEVITNPSAKYDPEGMAGIINVILKKSMMEGMNGTIGGNYARGNIYKLNGTLNYKFNKVNVFLNAGNGGGLYPGFGSNYRENYTSFGKTLLEQSYTSDGARNTNFAKFGLDFFINSKNTFTIQTNWTEIKDPREFNWTSSITDINNSFTENYLNSSNSESSRKSLNINMLYVKRTAREGEELIFDISYLTRDDDKITVSDNPVLDSIGFPVDEQFRNDQFETFGSGEEWIFSVDYVRPININSKLELGARSSIRDFLDEFEVGNYDFSNENYVNDPLSSNDFLYQEQVHAAYATYSNQWQKWKYQLGFRFEQVYTTSEVLSVAEKFNNPYTQFYPTAHISYLLKENQNLYLSFSRRIQRPSTEQVNPFVEKIDEKNIRKGNPFLLPEFTNNIDLGYTNYWGVNSFSAAVYFRDIHDEIERIKNVDSIGNSITTYDNIADEYAYGAEFSFSTQIAKRINLNMSVDFFQTTLDGSNIEEGLKTEQFGYAGRFSLGCKLWKNASTQITGRYRSERNIPQGTIDPNYAMTMSLKQDLFHGQLSIVLSTFDLINSYKYGFVTRSDNHYQIGKRSWDYQLIFLNLDYRFGKLQSQKRRQRRSSRSGGEFEID